MTSKTCSNLKPLLHDLRQVFCRNYGILLLGLLFFLLLIPFSTAGMPGNSIFNVEVTHQQMKFRFFLPELSWALNGAVVLFGFVLGILLFQFLLDKKQTTTFFALGLSRRALFGSRFSIGLLMILLVIWIPMSISLGLNLAALGDYPGLWSAFFYVSCGLTLLALLSFLLTSIACMWSGTVLEAICFSAALLGSVSVLCYSVNALMKQLLWGNPFGVTTYAGTTEVAEPLLAHFAAYNPILFFQQGLQERAMFYRSLADAEPSTISWFHLLFWGILAVILLFFAIWLFQRRKAEQAGISGLNPILSCWTMFLVGLMVFTLLFCFLADYQLVLALAIALLAFALVYWLCSFLLLGRYQSWCRRLLIFLGETAFLLGLIGLIWSGWFGFSQRLPDVPEIASATCSYVGSPNYLSQPTSGVSSGTQYYFTSDYTYTTMTEIAQVQQIHQTLIAAGKQPLAEDTEDMTQTVLPYDIKIAYTLQDGKTITRYYDRASVAQLQALLALDDTQTVKDGIQAVISGQASGEEAVIWPAEAYAHGQVYLADRFYSQPQEIRFSEEKRQELLQAIAADVADQTVEERYLPTDEVLGVILFSQDGESSKESFAYQLENTMIYLNENYVKTLAFLQENNLMQYLTFRGQIESIALQKYDPYAGINGRKTPVSKDVYKRQELWQKAVLLIMPVWR